MNTRSPEVGGLLVNEAVGCAAIAIVGNRKCPHCGRRFARLVWSEKPLRRNCPCGKRWSIVFELVDPELAERLGGPTARIAVSPYVDGRGRRHDPTDAVQLELAPVEDQPTPRASRGRRSVTRGTIFKKR